MEYLTFPNKKYQIIYVDPPWSIKLISRQMRPYQLDLPYTTMSLEDIKNLPIKKIIDYENGCHLFLWTTHKFLPLTFSILDFWGFKYHCCLTWDKTFGFTPFSFMWSTEFCLYAQLKNKWIKPDKIGLKTLITEKSTKHSRKPISMRKLIEEFCGNLPKIELFAREKFVGWDYWGDEFDQEKEEQIVHINKQQKLI